MRLNSLHGALIGATAALLVGSPAIGSNDAAAKGINRPPTTASAKPAPKSPAKPGENLAALTREALDAFTSIVRPLSHPKALETAFHGYFTFRNDHPEQVRKPFLYFVDYGLPSTQARGYLFDMSSLRIVEGPFTVAHGRGSAANKYGIPTRFSNAFNSASTSLGLYVAQELYGFQGHSGGRLYKALGMRLNGVSDGFNTNARARGVVAHGAPYVTPTRAGRSEGCPAMEPDRAARLLPKLANGGMVFLFAPNPQWMAGDEWVAGG